MCAALKRRFNFVTCPWSRISSRRSAIVTQREAELRSDYQVGVEPPAELARLLVTMFQELRAGVTKDGKTKVKQPGAVLSTAEAISVLFNSGILAQHFGGGKVTPRTSRARCVGAIAKESGDDVKAVREYCETVAKGRARALEGVLRRRQRRSSRPDGSSRGSSNACTSSRCATTRRAPSAVLRAFLDEGARRWCWSRGRATRRRSSTCSSSGARAAGRDPRLSHRRHARLVAVAVRRVFAGVRRAEVGARARRAGGVHRHPHRQRAAPSTASRRGTTIRRSQRGRGRARAPAGRRAPSRRSRGERRRAERPARRPRRRARGRAAFAPSRSSGRRRSRRPRTTPATFRARCSPTPTWCARDERPRRCTARATRSWRGRSSTRIAPGVAPERSRWSSARRTRPRSRRATSTSRSKRAAGAGAVRRRRSSPSAFRASPSSSATAPATARRSTTSAPTTPAATSGAPRSRCWSSSPSTCACAASWPRSPTPSRPIGWRSTLAEIRGKAEPGLDEVREATIATLCRGDAAHVDGFLWPSVDRAQRRAGRRSDRQELAAGGVLARGAHERSCRRRDAPEAFTFKLTNETEVGTSVFLHRLRVAGMPYASYLGTQAAAPARTGRSGEAGGAPRLSRVERGLGGAVDAGDRRRAGREDRARRHAGAGRRAGARGAARQAPGTGDAADVLLEAVVTSCPRTVGSALRACDRFAAHDDDLPSLARAAAASLVAGLVRLDASLSALGDEVIEPSGAEERSIAPCFASRAVHRQRRGRGAREGGAARAPRGGASPSRSSTAGLARRGARPRGQLRGEPLGAGLASGLLYLAQVLGDDDVASVVGLRLGSANEPRPRRGSSRASSRSTRSSWSRAARSSPRSTHSLRWPG